MRLLCLVTLALSGCGLVPSVPKAPKALLRTPSVELTQSGTAAVPAQASVTTTDTQVPLPPGAEVVIRMPVPQVSSDQPPVLTTTSRTESLSGPAAFTPPAPPSPSDIADGRMKIVFWIGLLVGGAVALFGLVRMWNLVMWGGICVAASCAVGIFFQQYPWLFALAGIGAALAFAGPYLWHTKVKHLEPTQR